ncbi:hypothetical protein QAD02_020525 [Eretmocerus hayati]|uniref:Uncharacterized protein n=1 Tax=Eretmocerus hayati TaxID=131215 RepID=A0ACC2PQV5_9HYME|nr:hypothetical protein QAD02_020525 [Eretmocerus hayati]
MSTDDLWERVLSLVNQESDEMNENVDKKTSAISGKLDDALPRIKNLESDMNDAINCITTLENVHRTSNIELQEQLYYGVQERMRREKTVIILGVPESGEDHFLEDFLSELIDGKEVPFELGKCRYFCIGMVSKEKSRTVKIIMDTLEHAKWLLINQKSLLNVVSKLSTLRHLSSRSVYMTRVSSFVS